MAGPAGFVGREGDLSRLLGALGGNRRAVLVVGDAGVGKTRFVAEAMSRAAAAGIMMPWGEWLPLARMLPMLPITDALRELARLEEGGPLAAALDVAPPYVRDEIARLLPEVGPAGGTGRIE
jgi:predicted ATPase